MPGVIQHFRKVDLEADRMVSTVAVCSDGSMIAVAAGSAIDLFEITAETSKRRIIADAAVTSLALSSDNRLLAVSTEAPTVRIYNCESGEIVLKLLRSTVPDFLRRQRQMQVAFLGKTKTLITRGDNSDVTIWNSETGQWEHLFRMPHKNATCAVSPDGRHFAVIGELNPNQYTGQVAMYRMHQGPEHRWNKHHANDKRVTSANFSPDGSRVATCGAGDGIRVWNVNTGESMFQIPEHDGGSFIGAMFVTDEHHLLTIQGQMLATFKIDQAESHSMINITPPRRVSGFGGSRDGRTVATYDNETGIDLWKISTER